MIRKKGETFLLIVGQKEDNTPLLKVKELFEGAGLSVKVANDIEYECWKKYIFIVSFGALTALYNKPMGAVLKDHLSELRDLFYELKELANIYDVKIDLALIDNLIQNVQVHHTYIHLRMHKLFHPLPWCIRESLVKTTFYPMYVTC